MIDGLFLTCQKQLQDDYLKNCDNGPEQGVKVLPIWYCISCLCLQTEFAAKDVHPKDTAKQQITRNKYKM